MHTTPPFFRRWSSLFVSLTGWESVRTVSVSPDTQTWCCFHVSARRIRGNWMLTCRFLNSSIDIKRGWDRLQECGGGHEPENKSSGLSGSMRHPKNSEACSRICVRNLSILVVMKSRPRKWSSYLDKNDRQSRRFTVSFIYLSCCWIAAPLQQFAGYIP